MTNYKQMIQGDKLFSVSGLEMTNGFYRQRKRGQIDIVVTVSDGNREFLSGRTKLKSFRRDSNYMQARYYHIVLDRKGRALNTTLFALKYP
jgi:hypothetical protein